MPWSVRLNGSGDKVLIVVSGWIAFRIQFIRPLDIADSHARRDEPIIACTIIGTSFLSLNVQLRRAADTVGEDARNYSATLVLATVRIRIMESVGNESRILAINT